MYLIRTDNAIHTCRNGQLVITKADVSAPYTPAYVLVWVEWEGEHQHERSIAHYSSREEAEDVQDDIWDAWKKNRPADISY